MKFLVLLFLVGCASVLALEKSEFGVGFPEDWYDNEVASNADDDGLSDIPSSIMSAEEDGFDFSSAFGDEEVTSLGDTRNILQVAYDNKATIFVKAAIFLGLKDELSNCQNITAFIPSNRAFARLPKDVVLYFLRHKDRLRALLKYHVIKGTFALKDLADDSVQTTLLKGLTSRYDTYAHEGSNYTTRVIQGSHVNCKRNDLVASNGYVHIVDDVIMHLSFLDSYSVVSKCPAFSTLYNGLVVAGMIDALKSGSLTVFAPTEKAFKRLPAGLWEKILADKSELTDVLDFHVVPKTYFARGFRNDDVLATLNKANTLTVTVRHDRQDEAALGRRRLQKHGKRGMWEVEVNNAKIIYFDGATTTGIIQVIDKVLLPPKIMKKYNLDQEDLE